MVSVFFVTINGGYLSIVSKSNAQAVDIVHCTVYVLSDHYLGYCFYLSTLCIL